MTYAQNLTQILDGITNSSIYQTMFDDREIENRDLNDLLIKILPQAMSAAESLTFNSEKLAEELKLLKAESALAAEFATAKLTKEQQAHALVTAQIATEAERKLLLETQKNGFLDNRVIKFLESMRGIVGEIEAGGLENPQENWDMLYGAIKAIINLANEHPALTNSQIELPATTPSPTP